MKLEGTRTFDAPREVVWQAITDPAEMAELIPGVQSFEVVDADHFKATVKIPLGLGALELAIEFEQIERREPEFSSLRATGRGAGADLAMQTSFRLEESGSATTMHWSAEVSIGGPLGVMGQRVLQPVFRHQVDHVLTTVDQHVADAGGAGGTAEP